MNNDKQIRRALWLLIAGSAMLRSLVAGLIEFSNDEVYYRTYAMFPDWSHFDHPPMVGWVIQLFTLNLHFHSEFAIRLGSVVLGAVSTYLIFLIGKKIKDDLTGLYAAILFTASFYCSVIAGTFIMPDTPQVLFWLASLLLLLTALLDRDLTKHSRKAMLLAGVTIGLALLSKYHSIFLIAGAAIYILLFNRKWLKAKETWLAFLIILLLFLPVVIWNCQNAWISFTFHESRVGYVKPGIRWDYFLSEMGGELFYNNPVNVILILISLVALAFGKRFLQKEPLWILLLISLPLALTFQAFSLYRSTLPHWTGPAYLGFILIAAAFLSGNDSGQKRRRLFPVPLVLSLVIFLAVVTIAVGQIRWGWIDFKKYKRDDITIQLYGWKQLGEKAGKVMKTDDPIVTYRWFPAANMDYYIATPAGRKVYALGTLERIHKYYWINHLRGNLRKGSNAYYIGLSDDFVDPKSLYTYLFDSISAPDTIKIFRGKEQIRSAYVYRLFGLTRDLRFSQRDHYKGVDPVVVHAWEKRILGTPGWVETVKQKAAEREVSFKEQLHEEALYMANQEMPGD